MSPPRLLLTCALALPLAACGGGADDAPPAAETGTDAAAVVTYEYHDEYGHGHCSVTELAAEEEVVVCVASTGKGTRIACFTREEAQSSRNAMGLLRLNRQGDVAEQEEWPAECDEALAVVDPSADAGGY